MSKRRRIRRGVSAIWLWIFSAAALAQNEPGVLLLQKIVTTATGVYGVLLGGAVLAVLAIAMMFNAVRGTTFVRVLVGLVILYSTAWIVDFVVTGV